MVEDFDAPEKIGKISSGSFDLNKWLYGGYEKDVITMIAGGPGTGKTNFSILASCSQAKKKKKVIFIDTEGGFSVDRVKQIVGENYKDYLDNILLMQPASFEEQKKVFSDLAKRLGKGQVGLVVVDGMAMLYRLELGDACKTKDDEKIRQVNREVAKQMRFLAEISRKKHIPVLITNQVYANFLTDEDVKAGVKREFNIVGGDLFKYWSKCIIELRKEGNKRTAYLLKHRSLPEKEITFEVKDKGIFKKGWI